MSQIHHRGILMPLEINFDNADQPGIAQPYSQSEVEELLFGDDRPVAERMQRLREIRSELASRESADWGDEDPAALLGEVDRAIDALGGDEDNADDTNDYANLSPALVQDATLDTLSPDDVEAREAIVSVDEDVYLEEGEDEPGILDESEWEDGDDFRPERGVH